MSPDNKTTVNQSHCRPRCHRKSAANAPHLDECPEYGLNAQLLVTGLFMAGDVRRKNSLNAELLIVVRVGSQGWVTW